MVKFAFLQNTAFKQDVLLNKCMYLPWKLVERRTKKLLCIGGQLVPQDIQSRAQLRSPVSPLLLSGLHERKKMKRSSENELKFYKHKPNIFIQWNKVGALRAPFQSMNQGELLSIIYLLKKLKSPCNHM